MFITFTVEAGKGRDRFNYFIYSLEVCDAPPTINKLLFK